MKTISILPKFSRTTLSYAAGAITTVVGLLVLIGWAFDIEILKSPLPGAVSMKANTAAAFLLAGLALILLQRSRPIANALVRFCALVIALVGFLSLCEYLFAWTLGIDEILFREPGVLIATSHPGRMAPNTALNFALLGFAFFVLTIQRFRSSLLVEFPLIFSLSISVIGLTGYVTGLLDLTGLGPVAYTKMAVHTAGAFIILCIGMLFTAYGQQRSPVTIEQKLFAGLTVAAAVIILISLLSVSSIQSLRQASQKVMDAKNQLHQLEKVLQLVLEVQSGQRGFLIAGDDKYLVPPKKAILELPTLINNLHLQIADDPHLEKNFESLVQLVEARIAFFDQVVLIRKTKGEAEAISFFATGKGKMITDSIRALVSQMIADEDLVLQTHQKVEEDRASRTQLIIFVSLALQVLLLAFIFVVVNRDVIGRKKAEEKLHKLNEELEDRVKERTAELQQSEKHIRRLNRVYAVLSDINQAIVRIHEPQQLFSEACRIAVEEGNFRMAWIGRVNPETQRVDVVAFAGTTNDYLNKINIDLRDEKRSQGPTGRAIATAAHVIVNDIENDAAMLSWRDDARALGYRSIASFPIKVFGKVWGAFNLYSSEIGFFDAKEIKLLDELAMDISFAIEYNQHESEHKRAEELLRQAEENYRSIFENAVEGIYQSTPEGRFLSINPALARTFGYESPEQMIISISNITQQFYVEPTKRLALMRSLKETGVVLGLEYQAYRKDGSKIWVAENARGVRDTNGALLFFEGFLEDITDRKRAEEEIKKANRVYAVLSNINQTIIRVKDKKTLFDEVCRIAVEIGKFRMAWIGMLDQQSNKVNPVASAGFTEDYLKTINIDLNDEKRSQGPTGRAVKSGDHY
ncbi:MAG: GAF domain-containing protein, partial [Patescibacteria group bacterium]